LPLVALLPPSPSSSPGWPALFCPCLVAQVSGPADCKEQPFSLGYGETEAIIYMLLSGLFMLIAVFTIGVFVQHRGHPVVRGSSMYVACVMADEERYIARQFWWLAGRLAAGAWRGVYTYLLSLVVRSLPLSTPSPHIIPVPTQPFRSQF